MCCVCNNSIDLARASEVQDAKLDEITQKLNRLLSEPTAGSSTAPPSQPTAPRPPGGGAPPSQRAPGPIGEHIVILCFAEPHIRADMEGLVAASRSRFPDAPAPSRFEGPKYHDYLTCYFDSFAEAASFTKVLDGKVFDRSGAKVGVVHKGAKASAPPHVQRRGKALAPAYAAFFKALRDDEELHQAHRTKQNPARTEYIAIGPENRVRKLGAVMWKDTTDSVSIVEWECLDSSLSTDVRSSLNALVG